MDKWDALVLALLDQAGLQVGKAVHNLGQEASGEAGRMERNMGSSYKVQHLLEPAEMCSCSDCASAHRLSSRVRFLWHLT